MVNYETKSADSLKALKTPIAPQARREGIAIIDVDPKSKNFGKIITDLPLPADTVAHHIFYNKDQSKAYITALGKSELRTIDMKTKPYAIKTTALPDCKVGEDVVFSADKKSWYVSCMGSNNMIVGDAVTDKPVKTVALPKPYPHGIAIHDGIDRILLTSTVRASDLGDAGETITAVKASTGEVTGTYKVSTKAVTGRRGTGGSDVRPGRQSAGRLRDKHVCRYAEHRGVGSGQKRLQSAAGVRFRAAESRRAARNLFQQEGRSHVHHDRQARPYAYFRAREGCGDARNC